MARIEVDARRMLCPMPVIRVQDRVAECATGDEIIAICTDPGALNDVPAWCRINGHEVLSKEQRDDEIFIRIRVGEKS